MSRTDPDPSATISDVLEAWYGSGLPAGAERRAGLDVARLADAFRQLPPAPFDLQVHHFAPLLEDLADD